jgi:hypothetical protein
MEAVIAQVFRFEVTPGRICFRARSGVHERQEETKISLVNRQRRFLPVIPKVKRP